LRPLSALRFDTSYRERRRVALDAYIEVRVNRVEMDGAIDGLVLRTALYKGGCVELIKAGQRDLSQDGRDNYRLAPTVG
jgi:hypothetical protein